MRMASSLKLTRKTGDECKNEVCVVVEFGSVETGKKFKLKTVPREIYTWLDGI
jgi:hypothetical protein